MVPVSVYNPTGSGAVHTDRVISGGRGKKVAKGMGFQAAAKSVAKKSGMPAKQAKAVIAAGARKASPAAKKANPALKKVGAKKANPFAKAMADTAACPPGSMSGGMGTSKGIGAVKKTAAKKATPRAKAMGEVGVKRTAAKNQTTDKVRKSAARSLPSQNRIKGYPDVGQGGISAARGSARTSGSDVN